MLKHRLYSLLGEPSFHQFRPQLQVNMRGRLKRVTHHQQGHQRILCEVKQRLGLLNLGPHDALDGTDFLFQQG